MSKIFAGQWGDWSPNPATMCITIPDLNNFLNSIAASDAISWAPPLVQVRNNVGAAYSMITMESLMAEFGGPASIMPSTQENNISAVEFELLLTLAANHGPESAANLNAAELAAAWAAALASDNVANWTPFSPTPAMDALLEQTFPGMNLTIYKANKELFLSSKPAVGSTPPGAL
jgi:hypothetical protein